MTFADIALHAPRILLPRAGTDLRAWSVVACDQYTSQPEYWERTATLVGERPSTLSMILPEAYLGASDESQRIERIASSMAAALASGLLEDNGPGFVRVERTLASSAVRRGLVVALDLDHYDYTSGATCLIRASEGTVVERLPPRVRVREKAMIESPHVMVLIDDPERTVIEPLFGEQLPALYDFDLMHGSGHIRGHMVSTPALLERTAAALRALADPKRFNERSGVAGKPVLLYAMGDGNHSFATAKVVWEKLKKGLCAAEQRNHPARYAMVELVNVHDEGLEFGPIHRVVTRTDPAGILARMRAFFEGLGCACSVREYGSLAESTREAHRAQSRSSHCVPFVTRSSYGVLTIDTPRTALAAGSLQSFFDDCARKGEPCELDYIHGDDTVRELASREGCVGFYLPVIPKHDLFRTVILDGALPRKAFSMGEAADKRFYLECRRIVP